MKDKTVVITGATSGLGRATALQLAQKGASVVIIARSNTKANEVISVWTVKTSIDLIHLLSIQKAQRNGHHC